MNLKKIDKGKDERKLKEINTNYQNRKLLVEDTVFRKYTLWVRLLTPRLLIRIDRKF